MKSTQLPFADLSISQNSILSHYSFRHYSTSQFRVDKDGKVTFQWSWTDTDIYKIRFWEQTFNSDWFSEIMFEFSKIVYLASLSFAKSWLISILQNCEFRTATLRKTNHVCNRWRDRSVLVFGIIRQEISSKTELKPTAKTLPCDLKKLVVLGGLSPKGKVIILCFTLKLEHSKNIVFRQSLLSKGFGR